MRVTTRQESTIKKTNRLWLYRSRIGCLVLLCAFSCTKQQSYPATANLPTLTQYVQQDTTLNLLTLALQRAGLDSVLGSGGPYTLFAPTDSAFLSAGLTAAVITAYDPQALRNILSYHLIKGRIGSATIVGFVSDTATSLNARYSPVVTQNYFGLFINGIHVTQGNIGLADGILHKIGQIAFPPAGNLLQVLDSLPNARLAAYIYRQSVLLNGFMTVPAAIFSGALIIDGFDPGGYPLYTSVTLLIPTDAAFKAAGYNSIADLAGMDTVTRTSLISSGVLYGSLFTSDLMGGRWVGQIRNPYQAAPGVTTLRSLAIDGSFNNDYSTGPPYPYALFNQNGSYEIGNDGLSFYGNGILTPPMIIQPNIVTTTGVIHLTNQVFTPSGDYKP
jgi:uncharacterized surface protein with fasciclin (FAS1) repeats